MKKIAIILLTLVLLDLFTISCLKAEEPEGKKEVQAQKEESQQQPIESQQPSEAKPEVQPKQQQQTPNIPEAKEGKERHIEVKPSPLTPEEQSFIEKIGPGATVSPNAFKSEKEAVRYLKIVLKGDHETIRLWKGYENLPQKEKRVGYSYCIETALSAINPKTNKEGLNLAIEVLKTKREYPEALAEAAEALGMSGDKSVIPLLREVVKNPNSIVRLKAGRALLLFGDIDTALPVLDELTREGHTAALGYIFHNMQGKVWEKRGIDLIRKALTYENNESKALAALFLIGLTKKGFLKEDTKKLEDILIKISEEILAKEKWPISSYGYSDHRALETVILAFEELKSKRAMG
ncbi:MAG: HEAT repeat domain-containing protein [Nitrospirota bacterium]